VTGTRRSTCSTKRSTSADRATVLELRAQAAYGAGEFEAAVAAWEELVAHERGRGDVVAAARAAAMIAMYLMMDTGLMAPVRGWLRTVRAAPRPGTTRTPPTPSSP
jgi:multidrug resistance efflux pump